MIRDIIIAIDGHSGCGKSTHIKDIPITMNTSLGVYSSQAHTEKWGKCTASNVQWHG